MSRSSLLLADITAATSLTNSNLLSTVAWAARGHFRRSKARHPNSQPHVEYWHLPYVKDVTTLENLSSLEYTMPI